MRPTFTRIYLNNFKHNLKQIRAKLKSDTKICIAVKADAYGHGAVECAKKAVEEGVDFLAIAAVSEGIELRNAGIKIPLLMLSLCNPDEVLTAVENDITPLVFDDEYIELFAEACRKAGRKEYKVHLAVDTGMGRIGCYPEEAGVFARKISESGFLKMGGICTHFAAADSLKEEDRRYTQHQFELFLSAVENVKKEGIDPGIRHCANSVLTLDQPEMHLDMCRPGIIAYGYYPGDMNREYFEKKGNAVDLKPVMAFVARVAAVRKFKKGKCISYGCTWMAHEDTNIAVLPAGYADGIFRRFNQTGEGLKVAIDGKAYPVRGRICMDQCMVDLGKNTSVKRWDEAVIFGPAESGAVVSAQEIADATGTISYEITCGVDKYRIPKVFVE